MTDNESQTETQVSDQRGLSGMVGDPVTTKRYLMWGGVALLALLAAIATLQVYTNVSSAIARFVAPDYRPVFHAAFNLVVLLLAVAGITVLLRRLQAIT